MKEQMDLKEIKGMIRRRKKTFIIFAATAFVISVFVAVVLPSTYVSQSTILIEAQQIPQEYVKTTITSYVEERIQTITQQIMGRSTLLGIINRFNLYADLRKTSATDEVIDKMRKDISLKTISTADLGGTGRGTGASRRSGQKPTTVAFTLSYAGSEPATVQKVTNVLASLYIEENLKKREERATGTTAFLQNELDQINAQIQGYAAKISALKQAHFRELPEHAGANMQALDRLSRDLDQTNAQIGSMKERKVYLEGQMATIDFNKAPEGKSTMTPHERLKRLKLELGSRQASLSPEHPDIIALKREIRTLEAQIGSANVQGVPDSGKSQRLREARAEMEAMKGKLGPQHPDVVKLAKEIDGLSREVKSAKAGAADPDMAGKLENPAYINLKTQADALDIEIANKTKQIEKIDREIKYYQRKLENAPNVEREYSVLLRDYENAKHKYSEVMNKLMESKVARGMEEAQQGERFTIIEPAQLPETPEWPKRPLIVLVGLAISLIGGVGIAFAQETLDRSIKTADELRSLTEVPLLSVIPLMKEEEQRRRISSRRMTIVWILAAAALVAALVLVHFLVAPLDVLWFRLQRGFMVKF